MKLVPKIAFLFSMLLVFAGLACESGLSSIVQTK